MRSRTPPRLTRVYFNDPLYFVTACTSDRRHVLARPDVHSAFRTYVSAAPDSSVAVGRYVLMPDHVHFFVRVGDGARLGSWVGGLKRWISKHASLPPKTWQNGFFDHLMRSDESYGQKWNYVRDNPVRAGLVQTAEAWPYAGEIVLIDRA